MQMEEIIEMAREAVRKSEERVRLQEQQARTMEGALKLAALAMDHFAAQLTLTALTGIAPTRK
jgi:hypothetical protein